MLNIPLPYGFIPRNYQLPVMAALDSGCKRAITVWHRRSGKDLTALNYIIKSMFPHQDNPNGRIGTYYHMFPTYAQGKKIIWDGMTDDGRRFIDFFPKELFPLKLRNETEMRVECINGSAYQIIGTDKLDSIVGTNQIGCVLSEYSLGNHYKKAKDLILPILIQNNGWIWFIYTPRGRNHGWELWSKNRGDSYLDLFIEDIKYDHLVWTNKNKWFTQFLTADDTKRDDGTPVITKEDIERAIEEGMDVELAQQEFYCSFDIGVAGSYFSGLLTQAEKDRRVARGLYDPLLPVDTWWDIGIDDSTSIWFTQQAGKEIRVIDYLEGQGEGLPYYASLLAEKRMARHYIYNSFNFPWDMNIKEFGTGKTRLEQARTAGLNPARTVKRFPKIDQIAAVRAVLPKCWFDSEYCQDGIEALRNYHKVYDEGRRVYLNEPVHDWSSHGASAFMTLAVGIKEDRNIKRPERAVMDFDVYTYHKDDIFDRPDTAECDFDVFS